MKWRINEEVVSKQNMLKALRRVEKNKGAPGIDNLTVKNIKLHLWKTREYFIYLNP